MPPTRSEPIRAGLSSGPACPAPAPNDDRVQLGHGSGGKLTDRLIRDHFLPHLGSPELARMRDGAVVRVEAGRLVLSTDSFVVNPIEFPGGNIGHLAVHGTVNDLAMMGAEPLWLTVGFILEEGLSLGVLDRVVAAMANAAEDAGVAVVAGDTKVVERGKADGIFINTAGVGVLHPDFTPTPERVMPGDAIVVSGPLARHGMAIMAVREGFRFESTIESDTSNLSPLVVELRRKVGGAVHMLRDATRGGVAGVLNEIARSAGVGITLDQASIPVPPQVEAACEMLGLDPLYVANEGVMAVFVAPDACDRTLDALREHPEGRGAVRIGTVGGAPPGMVVMRTGLGGTRVVDTLTGDQLPRIC